MIREPNTEYVLSLSYGKDSLACLEAIKQLGYPLDRIVHAEVWATDTIPADLPPMVEFKKKADQQILDRYGITVEHICASRAVERERERITYEKCFYMPHKYKPDAAPHLVKPERNEIYGFPLLKGPWCNSRLKVSALTMSKRENYIREAFLQPEEVGRDIRFPVHDSGEQGRRMVSQTQNGCKFSDSPIAQGAKKNIVHYLGIAADEPERIQRHQGKNKILPLVDIGWDEAYCRQWCEENDLLSPIYTTAARGGCWFCHNQGIEQLRLLRKNYPDLWALLLKWDADSPTGFKPGGRTVAHFEARFQMEDDGKLVAGDKRFRWAQVLPNLRKDNIHENYPES